MGEPLTLDGFSFCAADYRDRSSQLATCAAVHRVFWDGFRYLGYQSLRDSMPTLPGEHSLLQQR